jgi:hypothetical protein
MEEPSVSLNTPLVAPAIDIDTILPRPASTSKWKLALLIGILVLLVTATIVTAVTLRGMCAST